MKLENLSLLLGMAAVIGSFYFFGRATETYDKILLMGLIVAVLSYLVILVRRGSVRYKLIWTGVVVAGIAIQQASAGTLIHLSYSHFVKTNQTALLKVCAIMQAKPGYSIWSEDSASWKRNGISIAEGNEIEALVKDANISNIIKDSSRIFFRTFGMLDVSHGVFYYFSPPPAYIPLKSISGNWYY